MLFVSFLLRNKKKLANKSRGSSDENPGGNHSRNAIGPRILRDNITRGSKEFERRVKRMSQEFNRTKSRSMGALQRLNLSNPWKNLTSFWQISKRKNFFSVLTNEIPDSKDTYEKNRRQFPLGKKKLNNFLTLCGFMIRKDFFLLLLENLSKLFS